MRTTTRATAGAMALLLVAAAALVPPWRRTLTVMAATGITTVDAESTGHAWLFRPPPPVAGRYNDDLVTQGSRVDVARLGVELLAVLAATGAAWLGAAAVFRPRPDRGSAGPGAPGSGSPHRTG